MKKVSVYIIVIVLLIGITIKSVFMDEFNQDGIYFKLSVQDDIPLKHSLNAFGIKLKSQLDREEIVYDYIKVENDKLIFEYLDQDDILKLEKVLNNYSSIFKIEKNEYIYALSFLPVYIKREEENLLEDTKKILEKRLETAGLYNRLFDVFVRDKTSIKISKNKFIEIAIPHLCNKCPEQREVKLLGMVGYFSMMPVDDNNTVQEDALPISDSSFIRKASVVFTNDKPQLKIQLTNEGTKLLAEYTERNILKKIALVIDGKSYAMPRIIEGIWNGTFTIDSENLTVQEIHDFTLVLNSGVLPSSIQIVNKRSIIWDSNKFCLE